MTPRRIRELSFMGRMLRFHILSATPALYTKPPTRWGLIVVLILVMLAVIRRLV